MDKCAPRRLACQPVSCTSCSTPQARRLARSLTLYLFGMHGLVRLLSPFGFISPAFVDGRRSTKRLSTFVHSRIQNGEYGAHDFSFKWPGIGRKLMIDAPVHQRPTLIAWLCTADAEGVTKCLLSMLGQRVVSAAVVTRFFSYLYLTSLHLTRRRT
jgi:hypothetical protein